MDGTERTAATQAAEVRALSPRFAPFDPLRDTYGLADEAVGGPARTPESGSPA